MRSYFQGRVSEFLVKTVRRDNKRLKYVCIEIPGRNIKI